MGGARHIVSRAGMGNSGSKSRLCIQASPMACCQSVASSGGEKGMRVIETGLVEMWSLQVVCVHIELYFVHWSHLSF